MLSGVLACGRITGFADKLFLPIDSLRLDGWDIAEALIERLFWLNSGFRMCHRPSTLALLNFG